MHRATLVVSIVLSTIAGAEEHQPEQNVETAPALGIPTAETRARLIELRSQTLAHQQAQKARTLVHQRTQLLERLPGAGGTTALLVVGGSLTVVSAVLWGILGFSGGLSRFGTGTAGWSGWRFVLDVLTVPAIIIASLLGVSGIALLVTGGVRQGRRDEVLRELKEVEEAMPFSQRVPLPDGR